MKIKNIEERGNMIVVTTNNANRPVFVYPIDKFDDLDALKKEVEKSQIKEAEKWAKKLTKTNRIVKEFNDKIKQDQILMEILN